MLAWAVTAIVAPRPVHRREPGRHGIRPSNFLICIDENAPIGTRIRAASEILTRVGTLARLRAKPAVGSADGERVQLDFVEAFG
jgi:hypothetical protein